MRDYNHNELHFPGSFYNLSFFIYKKLVFVLVVFLFLKDVLEITEEEAEDSKPMVTYNVVTGVTTDKYMSKALDILQYIL